MGRSKEGVLVLGGWSVGTNLPKPVPTVYVLCSGSTVLVRTPLQLQHMELVYLW